MSNGMFAPLKSLNINKAGTIIEFPDLADNPEWKNIALERFNMKIKTYESEDKAMQYVIEDLKKFGYRPIMKQKAGFRPEKIK